MIKIETDPNSDNSAALKEITRELGYVRDEIVACDDDESVACDDDDDESVEVRLVARADGTCAIMTGDVGYDTWHGVACGASSVSADDDKTALTQIAEDLIEQVCDGLSEHNDGAGKVQS